MLLTPRERDIDHSPLDDMKILKMERVYIPQLVFPLPDSSSLVLSKSK
jgi:hypothetical protein